MGEKVDAGFRCFMDSLKGSDEKFAGSLEITDLDARSSRVSLVDHSTGVTMASVVFRAEKRRIQWSHDADPIFSEWFAKTLSAMALRNCAKGCHAVPLEKLIRHSDSEFDTRYPTFFAWVVRTGVSSERNYVFAT